MYWYASTYWVIQYIKVLQYNEVYQYIVLQYIEALNILKHFNILKHSIYWSTSIYCKLLIFATDPNCSCCFMAWRKKTFAVRHRNHRILHTTSIQGGCLTNSPGIFRPWTDRRGRFRPWRIRRKIIQPEDYLAGRLISLGLIRRLFIKCHFRG